MISIYIPPDLKLKEFKSGFKDLMMEIGSLNTILGGDINAYHELWDDKNITNSKGRIIAELINNTELIILNTGEHTHTITSAKEQVH